MLFQPAAVPAERFGVHYFLAQCNCVSSSVPTRGHAFLFNKSYCFPKPSADETTRLSLSVDFFTNVSFNLVERVSIICMSAAIKH